MKRISNLGFLLSLGCIVTGCHNHAHEHLDAHHHSINYTAYSPRFEALVEGEPLINNCTGDLVLHLTSLQDFKPVRTSVEGSFSHGSLTIKADDKQTGVYHLTVDSPTAGEGHLDLYVSIDGVSDTLTINNIAVVADEEAAHEYAEANEVTSANGVAFPKAMSWGVEFATTPVETQHIGTIIHTVAQILPSVGDETLVAAPAEGNIVMNGTVLSEGSMVSQGQTICQIDGTNNVSSNLLQQQIEAKAELARAEKEYTRLTSLREDQLALESEVVAARAALDVAKARVKALGHSGDNGVIDVKASRGGYLKQWLVTNGEYVSAGQAIAELTRTRTLRLHCDVQSSYYSHLSHIVGANIQAIDHGRMGSHVYTLEELGGRMLSYARSTEAGSPLLPVIFEINNVANFIPGNFVDIYMYTSSTDSRLVVPSESILEEMGNYFVYVQLTPEYFEKRQVRIGVTDGLHTEIVKGLSEGERVVSTGAMLVKMQHSAGKVDPHSGHHH